MLVPASDLAEMIGADCVWAAGLMQRRRETYASYAPVFWRPADDATPLHMRFLQRQIARDDVVGLRTGHGFVIGQRHGDDGLVDDFAVDADERWLDDGRRLLNSAWRSLREKGAGSLRVVSAERDLGKNALLDSVGLSLAEQWWVKTVTPTDHFERGGAVDGDGFSAHLGPAPPVYDPGGPVLLLRRIDPEVPLAALEHRAAAWGAVLTIVPEPAGDPRAEELRASGYAVASQWFLGVPHGADER
ncbi:MAG: hypothetical protein ACR2FF_07485 [Mycobacteriales bacterium]